MQAFAIPRAILRSPSLSSFGRSFFFSVLDGILLGPSRILLSVGRNEDKVEKYRGNERTFVLDPILFSLPSHLGGCLSPSSASVAHFILWVDQRWRADDGSGIPTRPGICGANHEISRDVNEILGFGAIQLFLSKNTDDSCRGREPRTLSFREERACFNHPRFLSFLSRTHDSAHMRDLPNTV